ncbi:NAD(P)H dehydrogenase subunit NdhS [Synechococcus sp. R55.6]|uniref:NAD(P)H dehydrogenase subunit NdhS n=1 Tax=unclassified Synechococcus TaxID=2626047 RepID=UPI0039C10487
MNTTPTPTLLEALPPIYPGVAVRVINPNDTYYCFEGQVQRVTDDHAAVLFEGGNWDKLVTFRLTELEVVDKSRP